VLPPAHQPTDFRFSIDLSLKNIRSGTAALTLRGVTA
jgi:hypothetical protein